ncbi:MAG: hypothetical protein ABEI75_03330, partial [Halobaculum sp.]
RQGRAARGVSAANPVVASAGSIDATTSVDIRLSDRERLGAFKCYFAGAHQSNRSLTSVSTSNPQ